MSTSNPSQYNLPSDEKFDGSNWQEWKATIRAAAKARGLLGYFDGTIQKPRNTPTPYPPIYPTPPTYWGSSNPSLDEWEQRDAYAQGMMTGNLKNAVGLGVNTTGTAHQTWDSLAKTRDAKSDLGLIIAQQNLRTIRYSDSDDLEAHIKLLRVAWSDANAQGAQIVDSQFRAIVLQSMPETWDVLISGCDDVKSSEDVILRLLMHRRRILSRAIPTPVSTTNSPRALATQSQPRSDEVCANPRCRRRGHLIANCYREGGGKEGQWPEWFGKRGGGSGGGTGGLNSSKPTANSIMTSTNQFYAFSTIIGEQARTSNLKNYADSAASEHCFVERSDFVTYTPNTSLTGTTAQPGGVFSILGIGNVRKTTVVDGKTIELTFTEALHTPELSHNLISIGRLDKHGCTVNFGGGTASFTASDGEVFMEGKAVGTMYEVELGTPRAPSAYISRSQNKPVNCATWHRRLGHAGEAGVKILVSRELVAGLEVTDEEAVGMCEDCIFGKQTRRPFDEDVTPERQVLERVHIDLWGPARVKSTGGKTYLMLFIDGGSSHAEGYFLADKTADSTLTALKHYHAVAERQTEQKLKRIRTDNGGEFVNDQWAAYEAEHGIIHETIAPYSSAQNGVAERGNRTFLERARSMLHDAKLPGTYWAEAVATAIYLKDFLPTARHPGKVPYELWYGKKPDVSHLRAFGCVAYAKVPKEEGESKLADRSIKTILVGYFGRGAYRLLDRETGKIIKSRDVIFDEGNAHRTGSIDASTEGDYDFAHIDSIIPLPIPPIITQIRTPVKADISAAEEHMADFISKLPIDLPHTHDNEEPDHRAHGLAPAHETIPEAIPPLEPVPPTAPTVPNEPRRSGRIAEAAAAKARLVALSRTSINSITAYMTTLDNDAAILVNPDDNWVPTSYDEAMTRPDLWQKPMDDEIDRMYEHKVWDLVDKPPGAKLMKNRWVFANKYDANGVLSGRKARLVAKGFTQIPGEHYFETYASVVRYESLRMMLALAAAKDMEAWQSDYDSAFLNAPTQVPILMEQPEGYIVEGSEEKAAELHKALYGTMDGAYNWWQELDKEMKELGYYRSQADQCVRSRHVNGEVTITSTYTDDVSGLSTTVEGSIEARKELGLKFKVKDLGEVNLILGIRVTRNRQAGTISLDQRPYLERVLERFGMTDCNPRSTPLPPGIQFHKADSPLNEEDTRFMKDKPYREALGSIMYAQLATRPDLSYAVTTLSKYSNNPGPAHWKALQHVLQYIKGTLHYRILYGGEGHRSVTPHGYVDASFADDLDTRRSCGGQVHIQAGGPTGWGSKYQDTVALSTTEAEYMALTWGARQILWMYSSMSEVGFPQQLPAQLFGDNTGAISLSKNTKGNARVKHIDIREHYIRERVDEGDICITQVPSAENLADMFTKPLGRVAHHRACIALRLCDE